MVENCFIIAEIGINHNGQIETVKKLIDVALDAKCNAVKFQKRSLEAVYTKEFLESKRESPWGDTQRAQKEGLEFGESEYKEIDAYCRDKNIDWFASAWDLKSQRFLQKFDLEHNKVASAMIVDLPLLEEIASEGRYGYISTGMSDFEVIDRAVNIFEKKNCPFELMHCISTYPMDDQDANLRCIETLRQRYDCTVGYSGHEVGLVVSYAAAALGITSLERHITLSRAMYGSDQPVSLEPRALRELVAGVRKIQNAMGNGIVSMTDREVGIAEKLRSHIPFYHAN